MTDYKKWNYLFFIVGGLSVLFAGILVFRFVFGQINGYGAFDEPRVNFKTPLMFLLIGAGLITLGYFVEFP